jgi:NADPH:quinone reductase-like Zn-dependent oxidoreductase
VVDRVYALEEVKDAHRRLEARQAFGKLVVMVTS